MALTSLHQSFPSPRSFFMASISFLSLVGHCTPNSRTSPPYPKAGLLLEPLGTAVLMVPKTENMQYKLMVS
ncbi:hypothetical protein C4D60_Mb05t14880 [Musa balbisiana]|uniref:Uncharacterized protein n=1 Tax=Musa balbisiana TaxID=52838 RepID=A0A4S8JW91_MUSBA|nr:hypothetical protein C4D60_Mb05t14880 [Musa balbisiana]